MVREVKALPKDVDMWAPGDAPELHPRWKQQVALEQRLLARGVATRAAVVSKARSKGAMSHLDTHRHLVQDFIPDVVIGIKEMLWNVERNSKLLPVLDLCTNIRSYRYLKYEVDPLVAAWVALRAIFDGLATRTKTCGLLHVASRIGADLEHEARMGAWEKLDPKLYYGVRRTLKRNQSTPIHRRRVRIHRFNALVKQEIDWQDWTAYDKERVGLDLLDVVLRYTRQFDVVPDPFFVRTSKKGPKHVIVGKPSLTKWLMQAEDRAEVMSPSYFPTLMPPKRWEGTKVGGYYTPYVFVPPLIRFKTYQEDQRRRAIEEYDGLDMPDVYAALHAIQEVPWAINTVVLDVAQGFWKQDLAVAGLPQQEDAPLPSKAPEGAKDAVVHEHKVARAVAIKENIRKAGSVLACAKTLDTAQEFRRIDAFYFPHMLDFRGRIYPIPSGLQPQGQDLARGLLVFHEGREVRPEDAGWLAIHLANCYGHDKTSHDDRIAWTEARNDDWQAVAKDPVGRRDVWQDSDDPWQALAAILEWVAYVNHTDPSPYVSHLPVRVDATCSGLQHLSALTHDMKAGAAVNLLDAPEPQDVYQDVADQLTETLHNIRTHPSGGRAAQKAKLWLDLCDGHLPRSLTKRPVMILPYGGTRSAYFRYILEWVSEHHPEWPNRFPSLKEFYKLVGWLRDKLWAAVATLVQGAVGVMKWLQDCASAAAVGNQPLHWVTPAGFVVRHFYGKMAFHVIRTRLDDQMIPVDLRPKRKNPGVHRLWVSQGRATGELNSVKQCRGISPNYIHSLDAATLMLTINRLTQEDGVRSLTVIHDAVGALAGDVSRVNDAMRLAFVEVHQCSLLEDFRASCQGTIALHLVVTTGCSEAEAIGLADRSLPAPLKMGKLDLDDVLGATYFLS